RALLQRLAHLPDRVIHGRHHRGVGTTVGVGEVLVRVERRLRSLIGRVGRGKGEVEKEGGLRIVALDQLDRLRAEQGGHVAHVLDRLIVAEPIPDPMGGVGKVVDLAQQGTVLGIEAALPRPVLALSMPEVPLAHDGRGVPRLLQRLRQQPLVRGQAIRACRGNDAGLQTIAMGIAARHERSPRRGAHRVVYPNPADNSIGPKTRYNAPISLRFGGGKAMVSHLFYYQLAFCVLVWLFVMLHVTGSKPGLPTPPAPAKPKRQRSTAPKAFAGLTHKPPCALCEHATAATAPPPPLRPAPMSPTNRRPRTVDTSRHFCPHTACYYRGWLELG